MFKRIICNLNLIVFSFLTFEFEEWLICCRLKLGVFLEMERSEGRGVNLDLVYKVKIGISLRIFLCGFINF